ncbi:MAG: hypothetical protein K2P99_04950, partial [Burkholderiales bacterium]|nr:hypothetical protein [Burkholderiales bacterium]
MRKTILPLILAIFTNILLASNSQEVITASAAHSSNNLKELSELYKTNHTDPVISYLYAKSSLNVQNKPNTADNFVAQAPDSYMKNDLLHQLLIYHYSNNSYAKYVDSYDKLINTQISTIETCGFDLAQLKLSNTLKKTTTDINWLTRDNITSWCVDLGLLIYRKNLITQNAFNQMLSNLVIHGNTSAFNRLAPAIGIKAINFTKYKNICFNKLTNNQFAIIYNIAYGAKKHPENAENLLNQSSLTSLNKILLANYIAMQYARTQQFKHAINLYEEFNSQNINNDEFEWKARSYLATGKWGKLITTIKSMPETIQNKNNWLYWLAKSYDAQGQYGKSTTLLKKIPKDYSYYYLIAQGELEQPIVFNTQLPKYVSLGNSKFAHEVENVLYLYQLGKFNNIKTLATIGIYEWQFLTRTANQEQLIAMSVIARNQGYYELSISSANYLNTRILYLSFPTPYLSYYQEYGTELGIKSNYLLAISRQESRFNSTVIALDGGE